jgi:DNA-binding response OmpR family regulator
MVRTVLVVEDDFDTQNPLAELLKLKGYSVVTASNVERALEVARDQHPALIITDIMLPGKSGLHLIKSVRQDESIGLTPIIVISGCGPTMLGEAQASGANFCLDKPIRIERFWATVEQIFGRKREIFDDGGQSAVDSGQVIASEIDTLVEELRQCSTSEARESVLRRLKDQILCRSQKRSAFP